VKRILDDLEEQGREMLENAGIAPDKMQFNRIAKLQYEGQFHQLEVPVPDEEIQANIDNIIDEFEDKYKSRYTAAAFLPEARAEMVSLRLQPVGNVKSFGKMATKIQGENPPDAARKDPREVYLGRKAGKQEASVFQGEILKPGNSINGLAIIDLPYTSVVVPKKHSVTVNRRKDYEIRRTQQ
jgi:N-methylhydantoinase A/oxoprolinase/acetone carboxylase beta subunit